MTDGPEQRDDASSGDSGSGRQGSRTASGAGRPPTGVDDSSRVLPTAEDPLLAGGLEGLGGPPGRHVRFTGWWSPARVMLLVTSLWLAAGYLVKLPCRDPAAWTERYQFTHACYTDVLASYSAYGLDEGKVPYVGFDTPYPPLTGAFMWIASTATRVLPAQVRASVYFDLSAILLAALALVLVVTTILLASRRRPWDAMMLALSPVLLMQAFTNWDLLAAALLGVAMVLWARRNPLWAGFWLGLAVAAKLYPALLLVVLLLLCLRAGKMRPWWTTTAAALATWAAVSIPMALIAPSGFAAFWRQNAARGPDWDSLWLPLSQLFGWSQEGGPTNVRVGAVSALILAAVVILVRRAPQRARVPALMFVLLALLLVFGKVFSPQDALWLTPLAVLARPRWRLFLAWQLVEVVLTVNRMLLLVGREVPDKGLPPGWWYATVAVRDIVLLLLVAFVVREMWRPRHDVVRADGCDDPAGGPLDGAPDRRSRADGHAADDAADDAAATTADGPADGSAEVLAGETRAAVP